MFNFLRTKPKRILVLMCNPNKDSLTDALAEGYSTGARESKAEVRKINLIDLDLDLNLYNPKEPADSIVRTCQEDITWAEHIVFVYPVWWGTYPAVLKGYIDRVFASGFAYKYESRFVIKKLLKGRSARLIQTSGGPTLIARVLFGSFTYVYPAEIALKNTTLNFCGISPVKITRFGGIHSKISKDLIDKYIDQVRTLGRKLI